MIAWLGWSRLELVMNVGGQFFRGRISVPLLEGIGRPRCAPVLGARSFQYPEGYSLDFYSPILVPASHFGAWRGLRLGTVVCPCRPA